MTQRLDLRSPWTALSFVVVDVEGNGQQPPDLVELAAVPISGGVVGTAATWLVRPPRAIMPMARRFHHISDQDVSSCPPVAEVANQMRKVLDNAVFVAHNAHVDLGVLGRELPGFAPALVVDTLKLARRLLPGRDSYKLGALVDAFRLADDLPSGLVPHRAAYDALVCARLLIHLATSSNGTPRTAEDVLTHPSKKQKGGASDDSAEALF